MFTAVRTSDTGGTSGSDPEPGPLHRGALAGPWRIDHELGHGGMGTVYAVTHDDIGKRAALKVVHAHALTPWFTAERFLLEARVVNQVRHPSIVDIFETGMLGDGRPYLVMERLDGMTLGQRLANGRILADEVCAILIEVCDAIRAAHAAGIVHRDLKLDNIFMMAGADPATPHVKVLDWGIAKILSGDPTNTFADRLIGTPRYVSPEQARGGEVTTKADIYSFGIMAYELFVEAPPFLADSAAELLVMHLRDLPASPRELWPDCPPELAALLLEMLAKDPADRPTIDEVARRLIGVRNLLRLRRIVFEPTSIEPVRHLPRPRRTTSKRLPAPMSASISIAAPTSPFHAHLARGLAVLALLGGVAASARVLSEGATADAQVAHAPSRHPASAGPAPQLEATPADRHAIAAASQVARVIGAAQLTIARPPASPGAPAGHQRAIVPAHHRTTTAHAAVTPPTPVADSALHSPVTDDVHAVTPPPSVHRPRRVAAAFDPDGTIEPYR